jgi:hypothetical protein
LLEPGAFLLCQTRAVTLRRMAAKKLPLSLDDLPTEVHAVLNEVEQETDRGLLLVVAALADDMLEMMIRSKLIDEPAVVDELFRTNGPASSFWAKTNLAYALGLLDQSLYGDLDTLREIRNQFRHTSRPAAPGCIGERPCGVQAAVVGAVRD